MRLLIDVLKNLFKRPFTERYPKVKPEIPEGFRGRIIHDRDKCIYCALCEKFCPSGAISVDAKGKTWKIDIGRCLFCGQCEEVCHTMAKKDAIKLGKEYELASKNKKSLSSS